MLIQINGNAFIDILCIHWSNVAEQDIKCIHFLVILDFRDNLSRSGAEVAADAKRLHFCQNPIPSRYCQHSIYAKSLKTLQSPAVLVAHADPLCYS